VIFPQALKSCPPELKEFHTDSTGHRYGCHESQRYSDEIAIYGNQAFALADGLGRPSLQLHPERNLNTVGAAEGPYRGKGKADSRLRWGITTKDAQRTLENEGERRVGVLQRPTASFSEL
jgi:hypothetical protein